MCGIVGYLGDKDASKVIIEGLKRLEYRGYDSAGLASLSSEGLKCIKSAGKLSVLCERLEGSDCAAPLGIGHTRWATHGLPTDENAHPHCDPTQRFALVHNGIFENAYDLRNRLESEGVFFSSETDSEVLVHLVAAHYQDSIFEALKAALNEIQGTYAVAVIAGDEPDTIVCARKGSPLIVGLGEGETFIASDVPAIMQYTRRVLYLEDEQICQIRREGYEIQNLSGESQRLEVQTVEWDDKAAEKDGYPHFMLKEIFQQPEVLRNALLGRLKLDANLSILEGLGLDARILRDCEKIVIVACGTAWHAGLYGKYILETYARIPVEVEASSEFRYRNTLVSDKTVLMPISQSGETADTLEAIRCARADGARVLSIVNVVGSSIARESHDVFYTHAGPEIGVASTKAYTTQMMALALLTLAVAQMRKTLSSTELQSMLDHLSEIPDKVQQCLDDHGVIERCTKNFKYIVAHSALYMGRTFNYPTALEGALKLKEISYIHAEGYAAGEMKHGPIALVTDAVPSICIAVKGKVYSKMLSNIQEIQARRGIVLAIATEGDQEIREYCDEVIYVPECLEAFTPMVTIIPLQLFSYYLAVSRSCDVDQPRNLAKSVTVE
jgi:glucosamine--fructose-6-phosphate aminotransferase (isomerizing)